MSMKKYTTSEGSIEVLRGKEASVLNEHFRRLGKTKVSDFNDDEKQELDAALETARKEDKEAAGD